VGRGLFAFLGFAFVVLLETLMLDWMPIEVFGVTTLGVKQTSNDESGDPSPFDYAQGQDDDVKRTTTTAMATARNKQRQRGKQRPNTGILHCVQDDNLRKTTATATTTTTATATATTATATTATANTGILRFALG
jgi:hypothetical protein